MHAHACARLPSVRTTIEIDDEHRAKLLEAAARRGEKGFSSVVREALTQYFAAEEERRKAVRKAVAAIGRLPAEEAERLAKDVKKLRRSWR